MQRFRTLSCVLMRRYLGRAALSCTCGLATVGNAQVPVIDLQSDLDVLAVTEAFDPVAVPPWTLRALDLMPTYRENVAISTGNPLILQGEPSTIYVAGGSVFANSDPVATLEAYDPETDTWETGLENMPTARALAGAGTLNGRIYVVGGVGSNGTPLATFESYDPVHNTWKSEPDLPAPRHSMGVGVAIEAGVPKFYAIGGVDKDGMTVQTVQAFDPALNQGRGGWTSKKDMPTARSKPVVGVVSNKGVVNNKIYVIGGVNDQNPSGLTTVEEFDPNVGNKGTWTTKTSMPIPQPAAAGGVIHVTDRDLIFVVGGVDDPTDPTAALSLVQVYDPGADPGPEPWHFAPDMPTARFNHGAALVDDTLYAVGGRFFGVARVGERFLYKIVASNSPTRYGASPLPDGLIIDQDLGLIFGMPTSRTPDTFTVTFSAEADNGRIDTAFTRFVVAPAFPSAELPSASPEPRVTSSNSVTARSGKEFRFQVVTENTTPEAVLTAGDLPDGLSLKGNDLISGRPSVPGSCEVVLSLRDRNFTTQFSLQLAITSDPNIPIITSADTATLVPHQFFTYTIIADLKQPTFNFIGIDGTKNDSLPPGLSFDGIRTISGVYTGGTRPSESSAVPFLPVIAGFSRAFDKSPLLPDTIRIRPPGSTIDLVGNNQSNELGLVRGLGGTGTGPLNFFEPTAVSRKAHGGAGAFDIYLPLSGNPGIECRSGGTDETYQVVFSFPRAVTLRGVMVEPGSGGSAERDGPWLISPDGTEVTVNLVNVSNVQTLSVKLLNVSDTINTYSEVGVQIGVLIGDTIPNGVVTPSDAQQVRSQRGQPVTSSNFREDVTANGSIDNSDVRLVRLNVGNDLP